MLPAIRRHINETSNQVFIIFTIFLISRLLFVYTIPAIQITSDSQDYLTLAQSISESGTFSRFGMPETYRTPGYPYFLSIFMDWFDGEHYRAVAAAQAVLYSLQAAMIFCITKQLLSGKAAVWISVLLFVNAGGIISTVSILTETLFSSVLVFSVWIWCCCLHQKIITKYFIVGCAIGLLTLIRPVTQFLWIPVMILLLWEHAHNHKKYFILCAFLIGLLFTQGAWMLRNYSIYSSFYISEISTALLYIPWAQAIKAEHTGIPLEQLYEQAWHEWDTDQPNLSPLEMKAKYTKKAFGEILLHYHYIPSLFVKGAFRQIYESGWMSLLENYNPQLPLTVNEQIYALKSIFQSLNITALCMILIRAIELIMNLMIFVISFLYICLGWKIHKKQTGVNTTVMYIIIVIVYLFVLSSGPFSNLRFREQYFSLLCILFVYASFNVLRYFTNKKAVE